MKKIYVSTDLLKIAKEKDFLHLLTNECEDYLDKNVKDILDGYDTSVTYFVDDMYDVNWYLADEDPYQFEEVE